MKRTYGALVLTPRANHPFNFGRRVAQRAGYPLEQLSKVPAETVEAFAGISCLPCFAEIEPASRVLDLGCGAGLDSVLVSPLAGSVLGLDFSEEMLGVARKTAGSLGCTNVQFALGDAESIPAETASIDVAMVNGIFNLNPERSAIFAELARVIRPGGLLFVAELVLRGPLPEGVAGSETDWFA